MNVLSFFSNPYLSAVPPQESLLWKAGFLKARFISEKQVAYILLSITMFQIKI